MNLEELSSVPTEVDPIPEVQDTWAVEMPSFTMEDFERVISAYGHSGTTTLVVTHDFDIAYESSEDYEPLQLDYELSHKPGTRTLHWNQVKSKANGYGCGSKAKTQHFSSKRNRS